MATGPEERRRRTIELVIAAAVVVISLASLITTVYQSIVMRRTLEASVWPRVEWENSNYDEQRHLNSITFAVANRGVGPARIARVEILLNGKRMGNENALLLNCCIDGTTSGERSATLRRLTERNDLPTFTSTLDGAALTPGQERILFEFERPAEDSPAFSVWNRLNAVRDELDLTVCYCSVFDDCWSSRAHAYTQATEAVDRCPVEAEPGFTG
jgi:hypothetical protein